MIRVRLPAHLRDLGRCGSEVRVDATPTQRGVIDALEAAYPGLRGTLREPGGDRRRPFVRAVDTNFPPDYNGIVRFS